MLQLELCQIMVLKYFKSGCPLSRQLSARNQQCFNQVTLQASLSCIARSRYNVRNKGAQAALWEATCRYFSQTRQKYGDSGGMPSIVPAEVGIRLSLF